MNTVELKVGCFGTVEDPITKKRQDIKRYTWTSSSGMSMTMISYGAIIQSIKVPDRDGNIKDVVLGFDDISGYRKSNNPYFGALVGRVANRIARGEFTLNGETYNVAKNWNGKHHLHGGVVGFDKFNFKSHIDGNVLHLSIINPDGYEGYPGDVLTTVKCELRSDNTIAMEYQATTTKPTPINLTNHSYFNLGGHDSGYEEIYKHVISINADKITETDFESIPTGKFTQVGGTPFDLRESRELGPAMRHVTGPGYDDNFCINLPEEGGDGLTFVSRAVHPSSGRYLEVYSNQPGVQLYTTNFLPDPCGNINPKSFVDEHYYEVDGVLTTKLEQVDVSTQPKALSKCPDDGTAVIGKGGVHYLKHGAFCLETQKFPDAVHHDNFPSSILNPSEVYKHKVEFRFGVAK